MGHDSPGSQRQPAVGHRAPSAFDHTRQDEDAVSILPDPGAQRDTRLGQRLCGHEMSQPRTAEVPWALPSQGRRHKALMPRPCVILSTHGRNRGRICPHLFQSFGLCEALPRSTIRFPEPPHEVGRRGSVPTPFNRLRELQVTCPESRLLNDDSKTQIQCLGPHSLVPTPTPAP